MAVFFKTKRKYIFSYLVSIQFSHICSVVKKKLGFKTLDPFFLDLLLSME